MADIKADDPMIDTTFLSHAGVELKRAERYRIFVSLVVVDLAGVQAQLGGPLAETGTPLLEALRGHIRASDVASLVDDTSLALLFPETSRQGAEAAGRRLVEFIRKHLAERTGQSADQVIPMEMASYPDAAGARSLATFLEELAHKHRN
jgi:hypothetical protein